MPNKDGTEDNLISELARKESRRPKTGTIRKEGMNKSSMKIEENNQGDKLKLMGNDLS